MGIPIEQCNFHVIASRYNQDMSPEKGRTNIDTIVGYIAPRAYAVMNLGEMCFTSVEDVISEEAVDLSIAPNPATDEMNFRTDVNAPMQTIEIYNMAGQLIRAVEVEANAFTLDRNRLERGIYVAKIQFEKGIVTKKIVFN